MQTESYVAFLLIGVVLVLIDGQLIYRSGREYLEQTHGKTGTARSLTQLVTVLFHLVVLGLLALISTLPIGTGDQLRDVVVKLGVVLLMLAAAHAGTIAILNRFQLRQREEEIAENVTRRRKPARGATGQTIVNPSSDAETPGDQSAP